MFVRDEVLLEVGFAAARAGLAGLGREGLLVSASAAAYGEGMASLDQAGPPGTARILPVLAEVRFRDLAGREGRAGLALRWEAAAADGGLFPVLDADITLAPAGTRAALLVLAGTYRPQPGPPGTAPDRASARRLADVTAGSLLRRLAEVLTHPPASAA